MPEDVNIIDVAKYAGVSVSTVSRVLNDHPDVSSKTRQKVLDVIEEYSYVPNLSARNLKRESMKAIGVVVKGFTNPFFTRMLHVIQNDLDRMHYTMLLHPAELNQDEIEGAISLCKEKKPRGLIFLGGNFRHRSERLALIDVPYVMVTMTMHNDVDRTSFSSVAIDDYAEAYAVTDRICKAGHTEVAAIGFTETDESISRLRVDGFLQALRDNGIQDGEQRLEYAGEFTMYGGYTAAKRLLGRTRFTCLFCISDIMALSAYRAICEHGLSIPEDVSVVGFDGIEFGRYATPSLATVGQPDERMARESVRILMNALQRNAAHEHLVFPATFLDGESFRPYTTPR